MVPITSRTPKPVVASFEKRQPAQASGETSDPMLEVLAGSAADALKKRASGGDSFDSLLCATLKALKSENPGLYTGLLQSCTSLIDSGSNGRKKALKKRIVVEDKSDFLADVKTVDEAVDNGHGEAILMEKRGLDFSNVVDKRENKDFNSLHTPL